MSTHKCEYMNDENFPGFKPNYIYKWTGNEFGWQLHMHDKPSKHMKHTWQNGCNWCGYILPAIDTMLPYDKYKIHRCEQLIRAEWTKLRNRLIENDKLKKIITSHFFIQWDGYHYWRFMEDDEILNDKLLTCQYCDIRLVNPNSLNINKVEIV